MTLEEQAQAIADAVHAELYSRKGFDDWWDGIDEETADDIMATLTKVVETALKESK